MNREAQKSDYLKFMEDYEIIHTSCPKCHSPFHKTTLMAFPFDREDPDSYQDRNKCTCLNCKDTHLMYERTNKADHREKETGRL